MSNKEPWRLAGEKKAWDQMVSVIHARFEDPA